MIPIRRIAPLALLALATTSAAQSNPLPLKNAPKPTSAAISEADLMTRLYIFADDSMMGRQFGREGNMKGTAYIARELARLGVEPAGDSGTYFQSLPVVVRKFTDKSTLAVDGKPLRWETDFVAAPARAPRLFTTAQAIYGGVISDTVNTISREQAAGKVVVFALPAAITAGPQFGNVANRNAGRLPDAAAFAIVDLQNLTASQRAFVNNPAGTLPPPPTAPALTPTPVLLRVTAEAAELMLGKPLAALAAGASGGTVTANLDFIEQPRPEYGRNVIGIIRGSDRALRGQYVALGAHNDHVGFSPTPVEHDSARAVAYTALVTSIVGKDTIRPLTPEQRRAITVNVDSLRRVRPARLDSINNGADDDGSGSMALLEVAEAIARMPTKPRRSILFVWHTGEEAGLQGARFFTANLTVPRDSIVTQLNVDMIGRGRPDDIPGGSPDFLGVVGSSFISNDLGEAVRTVNARQPKPLQLDYRFDADVSQTLGPAYNNIYRRSDHFMYAQIGIPIAFFFTGLHADYHRVTDEPQYIDYPHYARITKYLNDLAIEIANRDKRPAITKATP
ncbi:MAG: M28 family metallopeptidase [Gemmatimonadaceae bacterium]